MCECLNFRPILIGLVLSALVLSLSGCGKSLSSKVVGTWQIKQANRVVNRLDTAVNDDSSLDSGASDFSPKMKIQFNRDGTMNTETKMGSIDQTKAGTWDLISEDAEGCEIECVLAEQTTTHQIEFVDSKTIKLAPPNMAGLSLKLEFEKAE